MTQDSRTFANYFEVAAFLTRPGRHASCAMVGMVPEQIARRSMHRLVPGLRTQAQVVRSETAIYSSSVLKSDGEIVSPSLSSVQLPRVRYVLWNIYQINNLFNTYYTGLFTGQMNCYQSRIC